MADRREPGVWGRLARPPVVGVSLVLGAALALLITGCQPAGVAPAVGAEPTPSLTFAAAEATGQTGVTQAGAGPSDVVFGGEATSGDCRPVGGFEVCGPIYERYAQLGGPTGSLGRPLDEAERAAGGTSQRFEHGAVAASPSTGTHVVAGPAAESWADTGGADGPLGFPLVDPRPAVGAESVSYFQGGAVFVTGGDADVHEVPGGEIPEVDVPSVYGLPLADFIVVWRARAAAPAGDLVWTTDGCSGPTPPEVDELFADACLRHDFGYRNFLNGPRADPTRQRRLAVDNQFLTDLRATCVTAGEPEVDWFGARMPCQRSAQVMYDAVRAFG